LVANPTPAHSKVGKDTGIDRYKRIDRFWRPVENCPVCKSNQIFSVSRDFD